MKGKFEWHKLVCPNCGAGGTLFKCPRRDERVICIQCINCLVEVGVNSCYSDETLKMLYGDEARKIYEMLPEMSDYMWKLAKDARRMREFVELFKEMLEEEK